MKKINSLAIIFLSLLLLNSCSTITEGLGGAKKKGNEEFLVKKKAPLILPPSFGELPEPGIKKVGNTTSTEEEALSIEDMLNQGSSAETRKKKDDSNTSIEKSIIEKINE
jgi:PBP1b-binding outer membrane lipoprotein LpoB